ncbi:MAG: hydrogenase maturation nickel metallochaperone HypA [Bacilli bacterium]|nr:hydrogenase maturation nickel metallochaperone HypA [Bacilli bacterium]
MHELGIVVHVIKQVEELAKENKVKEVVELTLEVGEVSGVVKQYFVDAFEWAKKRTEYMKNCHLNFIIIQGKSYCKDCKQTFETVKYGKTCPHCGSGNTYLITGRDVTMRDIKVV